MPSVGMPVGYRHWTLRQGLHRDREELPPRPHGPGLRDRHQLQSLHRLPDGRKHHGDAGAGDRARRLRPQLASSRATTCSACGPTPTSIIDYLVFAQELRRRMRGAPRHRRGRGAARLLPCADELRRRPLPPAAAAVAGAGSCAARKEREALRAAAGQRPLAHAAAQRAEQGRRRDEPRASPTSRRRTCCTSSRRTRRCSSPGSASWCASCARSRSTSIRSARPR